MWLKQVLKNQPRALPWRGSAEYKVNKDLSRRENEIQAQAEMKQQAYDEYRADNIVFINTQYIEGGFREPDMIYSRGLAYKCY